MPTLPRTAWAFVILALLIGLVIGLAIPTSLRAFPDRSEEREYDHSYRFINPLLACGDSTHTSLGNDKAVALKEAIDDLVQAQKTSGAVADAGVYFRQLNDGPWVGYHNEAKFTPGSLLKVPLAMSVFEHAEERPGLLDERIQFEGGDAPAKEHFTSDEIQPGNIYSIRDLVSASLVHSDNNAALLLAQIIGRDEVSESYARLGINAPSSGEDYSTNVQQYASFFRVLYNGTYLSHDDSEDLLSILAGSVFTQGLVAGVPPGTIVAHKFGERSIDGSHVQLHDCGIVYHPRKPYLICIMLRGGNFDTLATSIADISRTVYDAVE